MAAPPRQDAHFHHRVVAVLHARPNRGQQQQHNSTSRCFHLDARYNHTLDSFLFRLSNIAPTTTSSKTTTFYLQITPDRIESLTKTTHEKHADNAALQLQLDTIRAELGHVSDMTSLEFKLRSHGHLVAPADFDLDSCQDDQARRDLASLRSLASALVFSLYIPHNVLRKEYWRTFTGAVAESANLGKKEQQRKLERMADLQTMYNGKGGAQLSLGNEKEGEWEEGKGVSGSCATTEAVDTPSAYASPPPYDENGERDRVRKDSGVGTAKHVDSSAAVAAPPKYSRTEGLNSSCSSFIHEYPDNLCTNRGSEDTSDLFVYAQKRNRSTSIPPPDNPHEACLATNKRLRLQVAHLQKTVNDLASRHADLDQQQADVMYRQDCLEETLDCTSVDLGELEQECASLSQRLPEELEDILLEHLSDRMRERIDTVMQEAVGEWISEHKDTIVSTVSGTPEKDKVESDGLEERVKSHIDNMMKEWKEDISKKIKSVF